MRMLPVLLIGVLLQTAAEVFSSDPDAVSLDALEGRPVRLDATYQGDRGNIYSMKWTHKTNENIVVVRYSPGNTQAPVRKLANYKHRVDFSIEDLSLMLNDPRKTDSGLYTAQIETLDYKTTTTDKYQLSVYERAAVPSLTVLSNQSSPDLCNVTLNCTGPGEPLSCNCVMTSNTNHTLCCQKGGDSFLTISFSQSTVSCNHRNPVSWSLDTIELQPLCPFYGGGPSPSVGLSLCQLRAVVLSILLVAMTSVVIGVHARGKFRKKD